MNLTAGRVLQNGKYVLEATLGQGGFGITYRARHTYLEQPVVIKTLNESLRHHPDFAQFQQQFVAEAQRIARCSHANIVRVLDFFEESGLSFIVMDYIPGQTLAEVLQMSGPLPEAQAVHYIRQIGSALSVVHQMGLLHRDVKPQNIIRRQGTDFVILIDFGIAREFTPGVTQTHTGLLSAGYAPLEQYLPSGKRTPATDVYALAATLYSLLTGQPPIAAPLRDRVPLLRLRQVRPDISPIVEQAIDQGLALEAHHRPQTVGEFLALVSGINAASWVAPLSEPAIAPPPTPAPAPLPTTATSLTLPVLPQPIPTPTPPPQAMPAPASPAVVPRVESPSPVPVAPSAKRVAPVPKALPQAKSKLSQVLLTTSAIAALIGVGWGFAFRLSSSQNPRLPLLQTEQSFPPQQDWPVRTAPDDQYELEESQPAVQDFPPSVQGRRSQDDPRSTPPSTEDIPIEESPEPVTDEWTPESESPDLEPDEPIAPTDSTPADPPVAPRPSLTEPAPPPVSPAPAPELPPARTPVFADPLPPSPPPQ